MTEHNPEPERDLAEPEVADEPSAMPRWVPILIGAVLVGLAALAVYTGLRYRQDNTLTAHVPPRAATRPNSPAPPGEPGAGASLVVPGKSGEDTPVANEPVAGPSRAVISGGPGGVQGTMRLWARRGVVFNVLPDDSMVYVNDLLIGQVRQFNSIDEVYDFAEPGSYNVKIVTPSGKSRTYVVTAAADAKLEVARISVKME